jgi:hypothetical protein
LQAFPNLGLFSSSFSKDSFGGFVGFQWVTVAAKPIKSAFQIFGLLLGSKSPSRAAKPVWIVEGT